MDKAELIDKIEGTKGAPDLTKKEVSFLVDSVFGNKKGKQKLTDGSIDTMEKFLGLIKNTKLKRKQIRLIWEYITKTTRT